MAVHEALFAAGLAAFERQPIGLVSILDITEAADVAKGVFYLHFKSKDQYLLELWAHVQSGFLKRVEDAVANLRAHPLRVEAVIRQFALMGRDCPAETRFWIRLASHFPDEVGAPGHLQEIRRAYLHQLAVVISGRTGEKISADDLRAARLISAIAWAIMADAAFAGEQLCDDETFVRIVTGALKTLRRVR